MPDLTVHSRRLSYVMEGDGFPLILVPDHRGRLADWTQPILLLGELCKVIAYAYSEPYFAEVASVSCLPDSEVADLAVLLDVLAVQRTYLAGYASGGHTALRFALHHPDRLEALLLIGMAEMPPKTSLDQMILPTGMFAGETAASHLACATQCTGQLRHGVSIVIPGAGVTPHLEQPRSLGHAMFDFLSRCERQRHLVRGASFLL
ncbi:2-succinyl-6-hydroxy-2,4-cyclohexadiene-1-carboxylate synthase [Candidatus Entotheonellaceae bacterium PAL068K]